MSTWQIIAAVDVVPVAGFALVMGIDALQDYLRGDR